MLRASASAGGVFWAGFRRLLWGAALWLPGGPARVLADLDDMESRAQLGAHARAQLRETLAHLGQALDSKDQPADAGR